MKNKINIIAVVFFCVILVGCVQQASEIRGGSYNYGGSFYPYGGFDAGFERYKYLKKDELIAKDDEEEVVVEAEIGLVRVGVLLPLTGSAKGVGLSLKNSALLAQSEIGADNLVLQFYDTKGTPEGAREAINEAVSHNINLVVGPLFSHSVEAVKYIADSNGLNIITFSTNDEVLEDDVFSIGLLIRQQVERIIAYSKDKGYERLALLVPDNDTGMKIAKNAVKFGEKIGAKIVRIGFFEPKTNDFSKVVREIANYDVRSKRVDDEREKLKALGEDKEEVKVALNRLKKYDTFGGVDFDTVLIAAHGSRLKSAASMFGYYDVFPKDVKFIGTSLWDAQNINTEHSLVNGWFPALVKDTHIGFVNRYKDVFGKDPAIIASLAYDAIALASSIVKNENADFSEKVLTNESGYVGIDGAFRLLPDGRSERSLAIYEVTQDGNVIIDAAPASFDSYDVYDSMDEPDFSSKKGLFNIFETESVQDENSIEMTSIEKEYDGYIRPWIFGKDEVRVEEAIYSRHFDEYERPKQEEVSEELNESINKIMKGIYSSVGLIYN